MLWEPTSRDHRLPPPPKKKRTVSQLDWLSFFNNIKTIEWKLRFKLNIWLSSGKILSKFDPIQSFTKCFISSWYIICVKYSTIMKILLSPTFLSTYLSILLLFNTRTPDIVKRRCFNPIGCHPFFYRNLCPYKLKPCFQICWTFGIISEKGTYGFSCF